MQCREIAERTDQKMPDPSLDSPAVRQPGKNILDTKTFLITISVKGDVSEIAQKKFLKWVEKVSSYAYVVAERGKSGQRHIHSVLCFDEPRNKQTLQEDVWKRYIKPFHGDSIGKFAVVVTVCYNHDWYDEYLNKEQGVEVLYDQYDRDRVSGLFPPAEVQQLLVESKGKRVSDTYMHEHCLLWSETDLPVSVSGALRYLRERMFKEKNMMVIQDERRVRQLALSLYRYRSSDCSQSMEDDEWLNRVDPNRDSAYSLSVPVGNPVGSQKLWTEKVFKDT